MVVTLRPFLMLTPRISIKDQVFNAVHQVFLLYCFSFTLSRLELAVDQCRFIALYIDLTICQTVILTSEFTEDFI